jgi:hypothetical protein
MQEARPANRALPSPPVLKARTKTIGVIRKRRGSSVW